MADSPASKAAVAHLKKISPEMKALIGQVGPCGLTVVERSPFQALVSAIAHQQLHAKAAENILGRLYGIFGGRVPHPEDFTALTEEHFRSVGFSRAKGAALRDLADKCLEGVVPTLEEVRAMTDQEIIERISQVRGIGKWTVEMMLMTTLGRPDVWPVDDFGVRAGWKVLYGLEAAPTPKALNVAGDLFRPYRSTAAWYLWRAAERGKGTKKD